MSPSEVLLLAFLIGVISGLRSLTAPAVVAWGARLNWINLQNTTLSFMGSTVTLVILTVLAIVELVADKLPSTPSRKKGAGLDCPHRSGRPVGCMPCRCGGAVPGRRRGPGRDRCARGHVRRLRSPHPPGEGAQGSGRGHRSLGGRGGDWRRSSDCVAVLNAANSSDSAAKSARYSKDFQGAFR